MGKPYSVDLRKRVVAAIKGGMSRNQAAKQFGVAISTAIGWMQRVDQGSTRLCYRSGSEPAISPCAGSLSSLADAD
jgi:transposase